MHAAPAVSPSRYAILASLAPASALPAEAPAGHDTPALRFDERQDHPGLGLTPERVLRIFREAEAGYTSTQCDLFDDLIENDGHLRDLLDHRCQVVAGKPMVIQAGGPQPVDQEAAEALAGAINGVRGFLSFIEHQLSFNRYGWSASEIDWVYRDGLAVPAWFTNVPARRFLLRGNRLALRTREYAVEGEALMPGKWVVTTGKGTLLARAGLMRTAAWFAMFKRFSGRDWSIYAEKFGLPLVWASYDDGRSEDAKAAAERAVANIGDDGHAVLEAGVDLHIEEAGRSGDAASVHGGMIGHCNREMSKLVNGSTLANDNADSGGASYAMSNTHDGVRHENSEYDVRRIEESFVDGVSRPFVHFNARFASAAPPLLRVQYYRLLTPGERVHLADKLVGMGVELSKDQLRKETGFKPPVDESDAVGGQA